MSGPENWVIFVFAMVSLAVYAGGGTYSGNSLLAGLSVFFFAPIALLDAVGSASALILPALVVGFFAYVLALNKVFGEALWVLAVFAAIAVMVGA
jgi:hypothetical protein